MAAGESGLSVSLGITEAQINNAIAVAVAESMTPERQAALIRDVVRAHLQTKTSGWDKETILSKTVGDFVRNQAIEEVRAKLTEMEPRIRDVVRGALGASFEESVFSHLRAALARTVVSGITVTATLDRDDEPK